ncbi:MAG: hypothetical protein ACRD4J_10315 [Nitrososphaeraceae archaeon]
MRLISLQYRKAFITYTRVISVAKQLIPIDEPGRMNSSPPKCYYCSETNFGSVDG